jgi:peptidoglycan/xylan/chitin deacetylase (PgdA/CDA1 family)
MWGAMTGALLNLILPRMLMIAFEVRYMKLKFKNHYPWDKIFRIILVSFLPLIPFILIEVFFPGGIIISIFYGIIYLSIVALLEIKYNLFLLPGEFVVNRIKAIAIDPLLNLIHWILRFSGTAYLFRMIFARNNITIVMYHKPEEELFRVHMNYLSQQYNFITLSDLIETLYSEKPSDLPKYALLVTFDDGWKENFKLLDIFREYNMRPVIFLSSHLVDTNRNFWFTTCNPSDTESLKKMSSDQRLLALEKAYDYYPEKEFPENRQALNLDELGKMKDHADFGSHTCYHTILTKCDFKDKTGEIKGSVERLEELLGMRVTSFAYPNGDYDNEVIDLLRESNIKVARTIDAGWNNWKTDPYKLKITGVSDDASVTKLASEMTGISRFMQYLVKGSFNGIKPII